MNKKKTWILAGVIVNRCADILHKGLGFCHTQNRQLQQSQTSVQDQQQRTWDEQERISCQQECHGNEQTQRTGAGITHQHTAW